MKLESPFTSWGEHIAVELPGARALFTTRRGGSSTGPYASLNLGRLTDDEPQVVDRNRQLLQEQLGLPLSMIRQVHGTGVKRLQRPEDLVPPGPALEEADGQALSAEGVAAMVLVADCLPIAIAGAREAAILHAGWRGLADGIVQAVIDSVRQLAPSCRLTAAIGPGIGACCYEVGEEVHRRFSAFGARRGDRLDLKAIARAQLEQSGVAAVYDVGLCTMCEPSLFFSHRRDRGVTGRQAGVVWLS